MTTTLRIALAQSPRRAAYAQTPHGVIEVRGLMIDRYNATTGASGQQTWTGAWRYELLTNGVPSWCGSYSEIVEAAGYLRADGRELDWQPVYERAASSQAMKGVQ